MTNQHPITPPPELVQRWYQEADSQLRPYYVYIAIKAARWGADQELEACVEWLDDTDCEDPQEASLRLRWHRRPKPPSLKEQALEALNVIEDKTLGPTTEEILIRRALEALPND